MLSQRNRAAAPTTAPKNNRQNESYRDFVPQSREKLLVGEFLWFLYRQTSLSQRQEKNCLAVFDSQLRRYLDLKFCGGKL